jgi:hypothetical protein
MGIALSKIIRSLMTITKEISRLQVYLRVWSRQEEAQEMNMTTLNNYWLKDLDLAHFQIILVR